MGDNPDPNLVLSMLALPASIDGRGMLLIMLAPSSGMYLAEEVEGREGGDGGALAGILCTLLGGMVGGRS